MTPEEGHILRKLLVQVAEIGTDVRGIKEDDLPRIESHVVKTNGRVTELEREQLLKEGAALQKAATIEDVRVTRAADLAKNAWVKPAVVAVLVVVLDAVTRIVFH